MANSPPNPPSPPITSGRMVRAACGLMRSTSSSPASMSTPASRYVMAIGASLLRQRGEAQGFFEVRNHLGLGGDQPDLLRLGLTVRAQLVDHGAGRLVEGDAADAGADGGEGDLLQVVAGGGEQRGAG